MRQPRSGCCWFRHLVVGAIFLYISSCLCVKLAHANHGGVEIGLGIGMQNKSQNHNIKSLGQRNLEAAIRFYDKDLFKASIKVADELNIAVRGFYHISASAKHWEDGFEEMMFFMDGKRFQSNMFPHAGKIMDTKRQVSF